MHAWMHAHIGISVQKRNRAHAQFTDVCVGESPVKYSTIFFSPGLFPSFGIAGMVSNIILPLCPVQYVLFVTTLAFSLWSSSVVTGAIDYCLFTPLP